MDIKVTLSIFSPRDLHRRSTSISESIKVPSRSLAVPYAHVRHCIQCARILFLIFSKIYEKIVFSYSPICDKIPWPFYLLLKASRKFSDQCILNIKRI